MMKDMVLIFTLKLGLINIYLNYIIDKHTHNFSPYDE